MDELLAGLNKAQRAAVTSDAATLQVLAPPGSGKTKTLTARVAYLITRGLKPWNIVVCTFTVKAAKEMQERIKGIVGDEVKSKLKIGTFHGIALLYLRCYRQEAGLRENFGVADSSDSLAIVKRTIKANESQVDAKQARGRISSLKSKGIDFNTFATQNRSRKDQAEFLELYRAYQAALEKGNLLDYDDILLRCVSLLQSHPECVSHVEAVLVDEFQDTNGVQYDLMALFAQQRNYISIVGDPDQSIYGWRSAEIKNLGRMREKWPDTVTINLEDNYRSCGAILHAAQEVIEQDEGRPPKKLQATHSFGHKPVLRRLPNAYNEAVWIVAEIKRFRALTGKLLAFNDFAILLRSASLSRIIEQTFGKEGIPYRMVGGQRFYDRKEVQIILDYLRVINASTHSEALERVINTPTRSIGEATVAKLQGEALEKKLTLWEVVVAASRGQRGVNISLPAQANRGLGQFIDVILTGQRKLEEGASLADLMQWLIKKINFEAHIKKTFSEDHENRWANVEELIAQAIDISNAPQAVTMTADEQPADAAPVVDNETPLCRFLANVSLAASADERSKEDVEKGGVVTISTIHAAKGLEWPVVFIPACFNGSIPHSRSEDNDEERRLLYVGMTRAQAMLYVSCPGQDSQKQETTLSSFLSQSGVKKFFDERGPSIRLDDTRSLSKVLGRTEPCAHEIATSSALLERDEDDYWPTSGERPIGYSEEAEAWARSSGSMPVFGTTRSASWVNGEGEDSTSFLPGFSSVTNRYEELMEKQDQITQQRLETKLNTTRKTSDQPKGRKRQIEGQGTLSTFFGKKPKNDTTPSLRTSTSNPAVLRDITNMNEKERPVVRPLALPAIHKSIRSEPLRSRPTTLPAPRASDSHYVFLSSSPTKPEEDDCQQAAAAATQPLPAPQFKPASTLHTTSVGAVRKTLGVKRSLNGWNWSGRKN